MSKRVLIVSITIAMLIVGLVFFKKPITNYILIKRIEKDILNFMNGKSDINISEKGKEIYRYVMSKDEEEYNISYLIEYYIKMIKDLANSKNDEVRNIVINDFENKKDDFYVNKVNYTIRFRDEDFQIIKNNIFHNTKGVIEAEFEKNLLQTLERILDHKSDNDYKDWFMKCIENSIIELPYNCYLKYNKGKDYINNELCSIKKYTKCKLIHNKKFTFNNDIVYIELFYNYNKQSKSVWTTALLDSKGNSVIITPILSEYRSDGANPSYVELKSHDVDLKKEKERWYAQQVTDVGRMIDEKISMDIVERTEEIYNLNQGTNKTHNIISAIEYDFFEYVETGLSKEEANEKILANWYYDNERKVAATIDINNMLYLKGVNNKEILERVREFYNSDLPLEEIRDRIQNVYQDYHQYIKQGMSSYNACMEILNNWVYD